MGFGHDKQLEKRPSSIKVHADQCAFGLETTVKGVTLPAKKPTGFLTNSKFIAEELDRRCNGEHNHFSLMEGRAAKAQEYTPELCTAICTGIRKQKEFDKSKLCSSLLLTDRELENVVKRAGFPDHWRDEQHEDPTETEEFNRLILQLKTKDGVSWAVDDVSGSPLDAEMVKKAREEEMSYFRRMVVYNKVPRSQSRGYKLVRTKWIDINKGDVAVPDYRSRLVAMEFNEYSDPSLFASTPPLEAMRYLLHRAATRRQDRDRCIMTVDVKRAYFNAVSTRDVFIQIPKEDLQPGDEDRVGKLRLCLYGTRDAAFNWSETVAKQLESCGYRRGKAYPAVYYNKIEDVAVMVHGDDYMCEGSESALKKLRDQLSKAFEIKHSIMGLANHLQKEGKILNGIVSVDENGWYVEGDQRHGELIIKELGLEEAKGVTTPGVDEPLPDKEEELTDWRLLKYRSLSARGNYLAQDRCDIQYAVKELCRLMSKPTEAGWRKLIRLAKYLIHRPRLILQYHWQDPLTEITTFSDANWAGCLASRKSTSGGCITIGTHVLKTWSKTQTNIALSSAESEFYATLKGAQESIGMISLGREFDMEYKARLMVDASAALGVAQRMGVGKIRHLQTGALWLQEQELRKVLRLAKVPGADNCSDILTKNISRELLEKHIGAMNGVFAGGRAEKAVQLHMIERRIRQAKAEVIMLKNANHSKYDHGELSANTLDDITEHFEEHVFDLECDDDQLVDDNFAAWRKEQCRQEGVARKHHVTMLMGAL